MRPFKALSLPQVLAMAAIVTAIVFIVSHFLNRPTIAGPLSIAIGVAGVIVGGIWNARRERNRPPSGR